MPIDLSEIKKKLVPPPDGQDVVRLRTAVVSSANADGTVDIILSGITIEDVPKLAGAIAVAGDAVQVTSYRGSLMVLGRIASNAANPSYRLDTVPRTSDSGAITTTETILDTITVPLISGKTYQVRATGGMTVSVAATGALVRLRSGTTIGGTQLNYTHPYGPTTSNNWPYAVEYEFTAGSTGNQSFVATMVRNDGTGTLVAAASATSPSYLYVNYLRG